MNQRDYIVGGAEALARAACQDRPRGQTVRTLHIEALPGGFIVSTSAHNDWGPNGPPTREVLPNVDALIGAVNRWHRDGQRAEHD